MAKHNDVGNLGEQIAKKYLIDQKYTILTCNWRWGKGEIDIICQQAECLVFLEVKTLSNNHFGFPEQNVSKKKQHLMYELATEYMYQNNHEQEFRFDILAITLTPQISIKHFKDAFFPHWND